IPSGTVRTLEEVYSWDQALSQGLKVSVDHPVLGDIDLPGPPLRFFDADGEAEVETTRTAHDAPPLLNEDAEAIVSWLDSDG
ncbi:MAG: CoA transferase, partial [Brevibacterium aurantiacum]